MALALHHLLSDARRLFVLTGAGCSTGSGIPDYRDAAGAWKRRPPVTYSAFTGGVAVRRRYWARSTVGYPRMAAARPNGAHHALARLEEAGRVERLVTQNVDGLHARAGSRRIVDLHGRIADVVCLSCREVTRRDALQERLLALNPAWRDHVAAMAPDGDADLEVDTDTFVVPACTRCGGMLKPDVVFFGENVPEARVAEAYAALERSDAVLVVGSSLMVFSGWRFVRAAARQEKPVVILNLGRTRADDLAALKIEAPCDEVLVGMVDALDTRSDCA
jgi:NAD-dependent SIR2 family protein deacetylase